MMKVDHLTIKEYRTELVQMMENSGGCLAIATKEVFLESNLENKNRSILVSTSGYVDGALVCVRRLSNWGVKEMY